MVVKGSLVEDAVRIFAASHLPIVPRISALNANGRREQKQNLEENRGRIGAEIGAANALPARLYVCI